MFCCCAGVVQAAVPLGQQLPRGDQVLHERTPLRQGQCADPARLGNAAGLFTVPLTSCCSLVWLAAGQAGSSSSTGGLLAEWNWNGSSI
jgi:hypothetical protein